MSPSNGGKNKPRNSGLQTKMIAYFQSNADRAISLDELAREMGPAWHRASLSSATTSLSRKFPENMERKGAGLWRWNSQRHSPTTSPEPEPSKMELLLLEVKRNDSGQILMKDEDTGVLYVVKEFDF